MESRFSNVEVELNLLEREVYRLCGISKKATVRRLVDLLRRSRVPYALSNSRPDCDFCTYFLYAILIIVFSLCRFFLFDVTKREMKCNVMTFSCFDLTL